MADAMAAKALDDGRAWTKFQRICEAQGGMRVPPTSCQQRPLLAERAGSVRAIDNRRIARLAKLAGAPDDKAAGVDLHVAVGDPVTPDNRCAPFTPSRRVSWPMRSTMRRPIATSLRSASHDRAAHHRDAGQ